MSDVLDRFLRYVRYDTQLERTVLQTQPSTEKQWLLLRALGSRSFAKSAWPTSCSMNMAT